MALESLRRARTCRRASDAGDRVLHFDAEKLNVNGGAIVLSHPSGSNLAYASRRRAARLETAKRSGDGMHQRCQDSALLVERE